MNEATTRSVLEALREVDRSGWELWRWIEAKREASPELSEAHLYPILYSLEARRLINGMSRDMAPARRVYRITGDGAEMLGSLNRRNRGRDEGRGTRTQEPAAPDDAGPTNDASATTASSVDDFLDRLVGALRLSRTQRTPIRCEIADHLGDRLEELQEAGLDEQTARQKILTEFGSPEILAESISRAQLTRRRLLAGIRPAAYVAFIAGVMGLTAGIACFWAAPFVTRFLTSVAALVGVHLYVPETAEWRDQQLMAGLWVGAFMAGRMSLPRLAAETRRLESSISPWWAVGAGSVLLLIMLLLPLELDPVTVVGIFGVPIAFVVGIWRHLDVGDDPISKKGVGVAAIILVIFVFLPGVRIWAYDPGARNAAMPPAVSAPGVSISWDRSQGYWLGSVQGVDSGVWHAVQIEMWSADRQVLLIVPDGSATGPLLAQGSDQARFPLDAAADVWVLVTAVDESGQRKTLYAEVHHSDWSTPLEGLLFWFLSH